MAIKREFTVILAGCNRLTSSASGIAAYIAFAVSIPVTVLNCSVQLCCEGDFYSTRSKLSGLHKTYSIPSSMSICLYHEVRAVSS